MALVCSFRSDSCDSPAVTLPVINPRLGTPISELKLGIDGVQPLLLGNHYSLELTY